ncbi:MAG TPA: NADH-quinone oxidoreductase subunit NuoB [Bryobacteraceae bacterium]|nr:NADH-quinone oxidoreductase subunit NuoB [Bryobacteraceae bacterium]
MFKILQTTFRTGIVTARYPEQHAAVSANFRGRPQFDFEHWEDARPAAAACPTGAIVSEDTGDARRVTIDYGRCNFCGLCAGPAVVITREFELAARSRQALITTAHYDLNPDGSHAGLIRVEGGSEPVGRVLDETIHQVLGRSLAIRQVDAGSCNGCELEIGALNNPVHDIERLGIHFVASPRHADMLLVTGPVTRNMEQALRKTYAATPEPKVVAAVGACGISGGIFGTNYATVGAVDRVVPVDVYIPGCPPRPQALLHGILLAVDRLGEKLGSKRRKRN